MNQKISVPENIADLSPELITTLIETQKQKALNEAKKLHIKEKELEFGARYSEKVLEHQVQMMTQHPIEVRRVFTRLGWIIGLFVMVLLAFLTIWIGMGKDEFALKFLQGAGYLLTTALGYWLGSKNKTKKVESKVSEIADAEIAD